MVEPLKNVYTHRFIRDLATCLHQQHHKIDPEKFERKIFDGNWAHLELKQRMRHITQVLNVFLPEDYAKALTILLSCCRHFGGFEAMFFPNTWKFTGVKILTNRCLLWKS